MGYLRSLCIGLLLWVVGGHGIVYAGPLWSSSGGQGWVGTWATAQEYTGASDMPRTTTLTDCSLREVVRVSLGGEKLRLRLSNEFGDGAVEMKEVYIADALDSCNVVPETAHYLTFDGKRSVTIPAGESVYSDAVDYMLRGLQRLAVTIVYGRTPEHATSHRGSRTTSYIMRGVSQPEKGFDTIERVDHWYNISGIEVISEGKCAIAVLGNSITDGRGSTTNAQNRWPDALASALGGKCGVLNLGIGGNCLVRGGLGVPGRERFDRDILGQHGLTAVVIFEGVNDIGGNSEEVDEVVGRLIRTYEELAAKTHVAGLKAYGATITPFGNSGYWSEEHECIRKQVNDWLRGCDVFDGILDFDALVRDSEHPECLLPAYSDDWLHLNVEGYDVMGRYAAEYLMDNGE